MDNNLYKESLEILIKKLDLRVIWIDEESFVRVSLDESMLTAKETMTLYRVIKDIREESNRKKGENKYENIK